MLKRTLSAAVLLMIGILTNAQADPYPDRLIRFIVSSPAGTAPDIVARLLAPKMSEVLGQNIVVENKSGANGNLPASEVAKAAPDGYTLLVTVAGTMTANPWLYPKTAVTELQAVSQFATVDFVIAARPSLKLKSLPDLFKAMRDKPGTFNVATSGAGSYPYLIAEMLKRDAKVDFLIVKHNGGAAAGASVAGEHTDFVIESRAAINPLVVAGKLQLLASTGMQRNPMTPDVPTIAESALESFSMSGWVGLLAPKGTPVEVLDALAKASTVALAAPDIRARLAVLDFVPSGAGHEAFSRLIAAERAKLGEIIKSAKLQIE